MNYSNVLHDMNMFILHYPNNSEKPIMCNDRWITVGLLINILIRTLDTFDSRNRVVMTSVNGGVM